MKNVSLHYFTLTSRISDNKSEHPSSRLVPHLECNVNGVEIKLVSAINELAKKTTRGVGFQLTCFPSSTDYHVPSEYRINSFIRDKVKPVTLRTEFLWTGNFHTFLWNGNSRNLGWRPLALEMDKLTFFTIQRLFFSPTAFSGSVTWENIYRLSNDGSEGKRKKRSYVGQLFFT